MTTKAASVRAKKIILSGRCISLLLRALTQKQQTRLDNSQPRGGYAHATTWAFDKN